MRKIFHSLVSVLPFYFDWVDTNGFQMSSFRINPGDRLGQDLERKLVEYLRSEERNGTQLAIAVVFDVTGCNMFHLKSEHRPSKIAKEKSLSTGQCRIQADDFLALFPAVYMRGTIHVNSATTQLMRARRNSSTKDTGGNHELEKDICTRTTSGIDWPYTTWNRLIPLLKGNLQLVPTKDYGIQWSQIDSETSVYVSSINHSMWLVAMKKSADENRWNRRSCEEREFFNNFSSALRLRDIFKSVFEIRRLELDSLSIKLSEALKEDKPSGDNCTSSLLDSFKEILGLPSHNPSIPLQKQSVPKIPIHGKILPGSSLKNRSHHAFFLGSHLMDSIDG